MREYVVMLNPFQLVSVKKLTGFQTENSHGVFKVSGVIPMEKESEYMSLGLQEIETELIAIADDQTAKTLIKGVITDFRIDVFDSVRFMHLEITTGTFVMDRLPHTRTFQSEGITYEDMLTTATKAYGDADFLMSVGASSTISGTVAQYQETDWAFAKRLASHFNTVLLPNSHLGGKKFTFGTPPNPARHTLTASDYMVGGVKGKINPKSGESGPARDMFYYVVREQEIYRLGDIVNLNGQELYVSAIETELDGVALYHNYTLKRKGDLYSPKVYNYALIGASLDGKILAVEKDVVKITLNEDGNAESAGTRWYAYSTVYSSPDGTGWYCMPEPGDAVRLYFPTMDETQAYVISSAHEESGARSNPDNKSIKNKQGKEALFMPDKVVITNNNGMSIVIDDAIGITFISDKDINFEANGLVQLISGQVVSMIAADKVTLKQGATTFTLDELVYMKGSQVRLD